MYRIYGHTAANTIIEHQISGDIYIHDLHGIGAGKCYCSKWMISGLSMMKRTKFVPPKDLSSFKSQLEQFLIIAANSTLGATGIADVLICMAYYVKNILENKKDSVYKFQSKEGCWKYVEQQITSFIYTLNFQLRSDQTCFTNVSIYDVKQRIRKDSFNISYYYSMFLARWRK